MTENEIATIIVDSAYKVHVTFGPGLLESVYSVALAHELKKRGLKILVEQSIPVVYDDLRIADGFRTNLVVEDKVIVELKSVEKVIPVQKNNC
jgi:GxxExxY protein